MAFFALVPATDAGTTQGYRGWLEVTLLARIDSYARCEGTNRWRGRLVTTSAKNKFRPGSCATFLGGVLPRNDQLAAAVEKMIMVNIGA